MSGARGRLSMLFSALAVSCAFVLGPVQSAGAATQTVTGTGDGGPGSLRQAVATLNGSPGADEIVWRLVPVPLPAPAPPVPPKTELRVDPLIRLITPGGAEIGIRHQFQLRQDATSSRLNRRKW